MPRAKSTPRKLNEAASTVSKPVKKKQKTSRAINAKNEIKFQVDITLSDCKHKLGDIVFTLQDSGTFQRADYFIIEFRSDPSTCFLSWTEKTENGISEDKILPAECDTPYYILQNLHALKIFNFVLNSQNLKTGVNVIQIYVNPSKFITLNSASDPYFNHHRKKIYDLLQYFLDITFEEYEEDWLYEGEEIEKVYGCFSNCYDQEVSVASVFHEALIPSLRLYQSQAVHWMLKREKDVGEKESNLHELYTLVTMKDGEELYFHKFGGFFVNCKFAPEDPCTGGILADEMGLGKTLEVLACILLNPRPIIEVQPKVSSDNIPNIVCIERNNFNKNTKKRRKIKYFSSSDEDGDDEEFVIRNSFNKKVKRRKKKPAFSSDEDGDDDYENELQFTEEENFGCVCGSDYFYSPTVCCIKCGIFQHAKCVYYKSKRISEDNYICPFCWISNAELQPSKATLIISPASIIYQWEQEIARHIKRDHLKVFMYLGVQHQKFVDPCFLAEQDIILVSYETLQKELNYVDVPHGKSNFPLRRPKRYVTIPSPMCAVQWWRICLDEAQMVESVTTKIAKMTGRLHSIHRWCVTGTPIKKSVEDLYGLLVFLGVKPYHEKIWWKEAVWKPFINGNTHPLSSVLRQIAWRTTKKQVLDQIGIPEPQEVTHTLNFSPIERVFYEKQHMHCRGDLIEKLSKFECLDINLCSLDRHILSKIMLPLRRLQLICCHFQINQGNVDVHKKKMTTTELLAHLLKTTKYECEDSHRKLLMAMSGVAGIYLIQNEVQNAVETYEKTLKSIEDNQTHFRTDKTQQIHSLYQLANILSMREKNDNTIESKYTVPELNTKIAELSTEYVEKYKMTVEMYKKNIDTVSNEILVIMNKFRLKRNEFPTSAWWASVFENVEQDQRDPFMKKIEEILKNAVGKGLLKNESILSKSISGLNFFGFLSRLLDVSKDLYDTRAKLSDKIKSISTEPSVETMNTAISCHLRPENKSAKCEYCEVDSIFQVYETKLFRFDEVAKEKPPEKKEKEEEEEEENVCFEKQRRGNWGDSDFELVLKFLHGYSRRMKDSNEIAEDGQNELKLFEALKKEFKHLRNFWIKCMEYVQQKDEIEMAKMTTRVLLPGEKAPNPPVPYILLPHEIQSKLVQHHSDIIAFQFELKKKMGQYFYLQNLEKAENKDAPFEEYCPVCQQTFGKSWSVLQCGHSFCLVCMQKLLSGKTKFTNNLGFVCQGIRCPVCRQFTDASDVYFIDNNKEKDSEEEVAVKGQYSTKTTAVIKCLLDINKNDPGAKSLVFSSFTDFLYILEHALKENDIKCLNFCKRKHFQDQLEKFKNSEDHNVLLIPLTFGCSGLNIIEATNVLLIEPILDNSKHLQAIGRVHRIGQIKKTTVHRFLISRTIEENIYEVIAGSSSKNNHIRSEMTLKNLLDVFNNC